MRLRFQYSGETYDITAERVGEQIKIIRNGNEYFVRIIDEEKHSVIQQPESPIRPSEPMPESAEARSRRISSSAVKKEEQDSKPSSVGEITAPMTGVIKETLINEGDSVQEGERVIIMEAMKMDIEITSPFSGRVVRVTAMKGAAITEGDTLVHLSRE